MSVLYGLLQKWNRNELLILFTNGCQKVDHQRVSTFMYSWFVFVGHPVLSLQVCDESLSVSVWNSRSLMTPFVGFNAVVKTCSRRSVGTLNVT